MPATGDGQSELPTQQARITGKRFSVPEWSPLSWPMGMPVEGVLTALKDGGRVHPKCGVALSVTLFLSNLIPLLALEPASSGFQSGLKTISLPGISKALGARLRLLKQPVLLAEQLLSYLPLPCGTTIIGSFNHIMEATVINSFSIFTLCVPFL